jgi:glycosyl transferase family 2
MSVSVVVPFRPDGGDRDRAWDWLRRRYAALHPSWEVVEGHCDGAWSKGRAVADALQRASGDVLIVADADSFVSHDVLVRAAELARESPWVMPHRTVHRLTPAATRYVLAQDPAENPNPSLRRREHVPPVGGGIVVAASPAVTTVPLDPRFEGWGGEDISWGRALDTLIGPHAQLDGTLWHLWHLPGRRKALPHTETLANRYLAAAGQREAIEAILAEKPYPGREGGGITALSREIYDRCSIDPRFEGWGQEDEAWGYALNALAGRAVNLGAALVHLWHPVAARMTRRYGSRANQALSRRYLRTRYDRPAMQRLVSEVT